MSKSENEMQDEVNRQTLKLKEPVTNMDLWSALGHLPHGYEISVHSCSSVEIRVTHENKRISLVGM